MKRAKIFVQFAKETHALINLYGDLQKGQTSVDIYKKVLSDQYISALSMNLSAGEQTVQELAIKLINEKIYSLGVDYEDKKINHFKFILASYFDEMMIIMSYNNHNWSNFLLEEKLFFTFISGEKLVKHISDFIVQHPVGDNPLAFVYLYILAFGYRGMLKNEIRKIAKLKRQLLSILNHDFSLSTEAIYTISEQAYSNKIQYAADGVCINYNMLYMKIIITAILMFFTIIALIKSIYIDVLIT